MMFLRHPDLLPARAFVRRCVVATKHTITELLAVCVSLPLLAVLFCIEPFRKIRFYHVGRVDRVGQLAYASFAQLAVWRSEGKAADTTHCVLMYGAKNRPLFDVVKRHLPVIENRLVNRLADLAAPFMKRTRFFRYDHRTFSYYTVASYSAQRQGMLSLTAEEEECGRAELAAMGIGPNDWFVCVHNRDNAYLENKLHDYRNSSIESYLKAAEQVTQSGGFAIRMGAKVQKPLTTNNPRIIDYATHHRSAFMDVYLAAKCRMFLGSSSGLLIVALAFGRPYACTNLVPYNSLGADGWPWMPKLMRDAASGRLLTMRDIKNLGLFNPELKSEDVYEICREQSVEFVENTPDDVLDLYLDMNDAIAGVAPSPQAREVQKYYKDRLVMVPGDRTYAADIAPRFALRYQELICG